MVPFTLFHGTSSHYLAAFRPGTAPGGWSYKDAAVNLLRDAWSALRALNREPNWYIVRTLDQSSGPSNWQHGELYVTPSKGSAVRYAGSGGTYGGELLTMCKEAINSLAELDRDGAERLLQDAKQLADLLRGGGRPILVEIVDVCESDLSPETETDNVVQELSSLAKLNPSIREALAQQMNFRLQPGSGTVARVFNLEITNPNDPLSDFHSTEILGSALWS